MTTTAQFIETQVFDGLRNTLDCAASSVRFSPSAQPVDCLLSGSSQDGRIIDPGLDPEYALTIYLKKSDFQQLADDKTVEILDGAEWKKYRAGQIQIKARAIVRIDLHFLHGKLNR